MNFALSSLSHSLTHAHTSLSLSLSLFPLLSLSNQCGRFSPSHIPIHSRVHTQQIPRDLHVSPVLFLDRRPARLRRCGLAHPSPGHWSFPQLETLHIPLLSPCLLWGLALSPTTREPQISTRGMFIQVYTCTYTVVSMGEHCHSLF